MATFYLWPEEGVGLRHPLFSDKCPGLSQVVALNALSKLAGCSFAVWVRVTSLALSISLMRSFLDLDSH